MSHFPTFLQSKFFSLREFAKQIKEGVQGLQACLFCALTR